MLSCQDPDTSKQIPNKVGSGNGPSERLTEKVRVHRNAGATPPLTVGREPSAKTPPAGGGRWDSGAPSPHQEEREEELAASRRS